VVEASKTSDSTPGPANQDTAPGRQDIALERSAGSRRTAPRAASSVPSVVAVAAAAPGPAVGPGTDESAAAPADLKQDVIPTVPLEASPVDAPALIASSREPAVFNSDDPGISEPILVKPYLPLRQAVGTPSGVLGVLELLVDTRGMVESVHLRSPVNRYRERWWVFAAKQWQFQPALKNGKPVKFLKRIPLTDLNMLEPQ
jgi:hypothetical protein